MRSKLFLFLIFCHVIFAMSCRTNKTSSEDAVTIDGHPGWIMQGNIYEVNIRQYTPEGTFQAFEQHLGRLKDMGVQTLWFMPIHPISKVDRKGTLGSYYAVSDYTAVNPEFGTMEDWKNLVEEIHKKDMKAIIDWVPNHTGADHRWIASNPDFYVKDASGKFVSPVDWTDVRKLNYKNSVLADSMIAAMKFWVDKTKIDGFRCDVAGEVPGEFWSSAIAELKKEKNLFMLAESNDARMHGVGFDATYTWDAFNMMKQIAKGERPAFGIDSILHKVDSSYPTNALRMYFTSNHDENSWNKADYGTMPKDVHAPFAVLTHTIKASVPLIYSGQEEPFLDSLSFFYKDTITWGQFKRAPFYKTLLNLRKNNSALAANASFTKLETNMDNNIYTFMREKDGKKVVVVLNLSNTPQTFKFKNVLVNGDPLNVFTGKEEHLSTDSQKSLPDWGYAVYEYR